MDAVLHGGGEQIASSLCEGGDEQRGGLDIGDGVGAGVALGQQGAGLAGGEAGGGKCKQKVPVDVLAVDSCFYDGCIVHRRDGHTAAKAGGDVVGVTLATAGFLENLLRGPVERTEVVG